MNRKNIISIIVLDIIVLFMAAGLILFRYNSLSSPLAKATPASEQTSTTIETTKPEIRNDEKLDDEDTAPAVTGKKRNIGFTFRHSKAKRVAVIGDFNDWVPQAMKKGDGYQWSLSASMLPGEYAYNFVVDGKPIRDPNNQKICDTGRGFKSSYLKINQ